MQKVAFHLRAAILNTEKREFPENITLNDIYNGESDVPQTVQDFVDMIVFGANKKKRLQV